MSFLSNHSIASQIPVKGCVYSYMHTCRQLKIFSSLNVDFKVKSLRKSVLQKPFAFLFCHNSKASLFLSSTHTKTKINATRSSYLLCFSRHRSSISPWLISRRFFCRSARNCCCFFPFTSSNLRSPILSSHFSRLYKNSQRNNVGFCAQIFFCDVSILSNNSSIFVLSFLNFAFYALCLYMWNIKSFLVFVSNSNYKTRRNAK